MKNYHYWIILKNRNFQGQIPVTQRVKILKAISAASLFFPSLSATSQSTHSHIHTHTGATAPHAPAKQATHPHLCLPL